MTDLSWFDQLRIEIQSTFLVLDHQGKSQYGPYCDVGSLLGFFSSWNRLRYRILNLLATSVLLSAKSGKYQTNNSDSHFQAWTQSPPSNHTTLSSRNYSSPRKGDSNREADPGLNSAWRTGHSDIFLRFLWTSSWERLQKTGPFSFQMISFSVASVARSHRNLLVCGGAGRRGFSWFWLSGSSLGASVCGMK